MWLIPGWRKGVSVCERGRQMAEELKTMTERERERDGRERERDGRGTGKTPYWGKLFCCRRLADLNFSKRDSISSRTLGVYRTTSFTVP